MFVEKYKWGQGKDTRLWSSVAIALITAIGCWRLYDRLQATLDVTQTISLWISTVVPLGIFAIMAGVLYWLVNKPTVADFLIAAEGELKKVSFSSKQEIAVSTFVVIIVVILMAVMLGAADFCFNLFFADVIGI
ncbi:MAG: preprotein translocase subunit SecE [Planctomycetes bacterium HGW-Planctomycetes-1]|nr:MAG: preprotein translocase subunit SecE [Planctomycetes bacterium HGW-Planctomycetes-1]